MSSNERPSSGRDAFVIDSSDADSTQSEPRQRIRLLKGGGILLEPTGFRIIETRGIKRSPLHAYESITHIAATARALLLGTTTGLTIIRSSDFPDPERGPQEAREALLARLATRPDGEFGLARVERLERLGNRKSRNWAIWTAVVLCLVATIAQLRDPMVVEYGSFVPELFGHGEIWRAVTSHFLHGLPRFPVHLAVNVGGLLVLGYLVERPLGTAKTIVVLALGGIGAVAGSIYYGYQEVVGASGLVSALVGAMLALEWHYPESLPAYWRIPRRIFVLAIVIQFLVIDQIFSSYLAGGAHIGGFIGGYAAIWFVRGPSSEETQTRSTLRMAAMSAFLIVGLGVSPVVSLVLHDEEALERHGLRLLNSPTALGIEHDNAIAWFIVTEGDPSPTGLDVAVALASRAVDATGRMDPNVLDTLAEVFFRAGDVFAAVLTIEEAIRLAPMEPYFYEQRKRFTGERAADDRPTPPGEGSSGGGSEDEEGEMIFDPDAPSITL